jgi:DNA repair exonuclease SbcCD ATPase subunit
MKLADIDNAIRPLLAEASALEKKAKELRALASEYESKLSEIYGRQEPVVTPDATQETLINAIRRKNGRIKDYAERLRLPVSQIEQIVAESKGQIYPDGRGWLKIREDFQAAA